MKHLKMLGLLVTAAAALMAFAGPASANPVLTDAAKPNVAYTGAINSTLTGSSLMQVGFGNKTCTESTIAWNSTTNNTTHASGSITTLTFPQASCNGTAIVLAKGSLTIAPGGTVTGAGTELTTERFGVHCIYGTAAGTHLGTLKGGTKATLTISAKLPLIKPSVFCGNPMTWTANYVVTTPHQIIVH
jgi:hypothetical protein